MKTSHATYRKPIAFVRGTERQIPYGIFVKTMAAIATLRRKTRISDLVWL